MLKIASCV